MGEFHRDHAARFEQDLHPCDEVVQVRHMGKHVIAQQKVRLTSFGGKFLCRIHSEKLHQRIDTFLARSLGYVGGRLHAQDRNLLLHEILQKVAVVAGYFDYEARWVETKPPDHLVHILLRVFEPGIRKRRKICILVIEYRVRTFELLELDQQACTAYISMQRVKRFLEIQLLALQKRIGNGRHAQIRECMLKRRITKSTLAETHCDGIFE